MPADRAASVRVQPSNTIASASILCVAATSLLRRAATRNPLASRSIRVIDTVMLDPPAFHGSESNPAASRQITFESALWASGMTLSLSALVFIHDLVAL